MKTVNKVAVKVIAVVKAAIVQIRSEKAQHAFRLVRVAAAYVATTGIVDQLAHGTATRAGIAAVATGLFEVAFRSVKPVVKA